jgi:tetratricopeptide (TPR) repeat protein
MAIEGSLADVSLADICQLLALGRKTGCLTVTDRSNFGYIFFRGGRVTYATVLDRPDRLGDILVKNGVIQPEDLTRAMEAQGREEEKRLGQILVESGALSTEELEKWVRIQVEEAVYHLFTWNKGTFSFKPDQLPDQAEVLLVSLSTDGLLLEGARRVDEWALIEKVIPSLDLVFKMVRDPGEAEGVELTGTQKKILHLLDGARTVRELVDDSGLVEFEVGKAVYELVQAGFVQSLGEKTRPEGKGEEDDLLKERLRLGQAFYRAGMLEDAAREFNGALQVEPSDPVARFRLGIIHLKLGDPSGALEHLESMPEELTRRPSVLRNRALALEEAGRFHEASEALRQAEAQDPGDSEIILARAIAELKAGRADAARGAFVRYRNKVGRKDPPPVYFGYAVLAAGLSGNLEEAVSLGREGLKLYPTEASILVNTGAVLDHQGGHEAAEQYFMRAVNSGSEVPAQAFKNLGDQAFRRGDRKGAKAHYEDAIRLDPALGDDVFFKLGSIAVEEGDRELARLLLGRAIELNPENEEARDRLAALASPS